MRVILDPCNYDPDLRKQFATRNLLDNFQSIMNHCQSDSNVLKYICGLKLFTEYYV